MIGTRYNLTVRREDILELYENQFEFRLFSKENYGSLTYAGLFAIGLIGASFNLFEYGNNRLLPIIACTIGIGYNLVTVYNKSRAPKKTKINVEKWIDNFVQYKDHSIVIGENSFTYFRDTQIHRYDLSKIEKKYSDTDHFTLSMIGGGKIILPAKSFERGKYEEFVACVDDMIRVLNTDAEKIKTGPQQ